MKLKLCLLLAASIIFWAYNKLFFFEVYIKNVCVEGVITFKANMCHSLLYFPLGRLSQHRLITKSNWVQF